MIILKNSILFVFLYMGLLLNTTLALGMALEPASRYSQDKVHEFLGYLGIKNAHEIAVYKFNSQECMTENEVAIKFGVFSGIWVNERKWLCNPSIKTEQDVIWRLAMVSTMYSFGVKQIFLRIFSLVFSAAPFVVNNVLLTLLLKNDRAKHYSLGLKILAGTVTNIVSAMATIKLYNPH